jgi:hypothetical protein
MNDTIHIDIKEETPSPYLHGKSPEWLYEKQQELIQKGIRGPYKVLMNEDGEYYMTTLFSYLQTKRISKMIVED